MGNKCYYYVGKRQFLLLISFGILNFGALGLGSFLMGEGPQGEWYQALEKAPWTPPGWVFGAAWFLIMLLLTISLMRYFSRNSSFAFSTIYAIHLIFNITWNYIFFNQENIGLALAVILLLTAIVFYMAVFLGKKSAANGVLLLPYCLWLSIATSLNMYALIYN